MMTKIGIVLVFFGFVALAGSAGDCDGKCMENANTIPEMLTAIGIGLAMLATGACLIIKGEDNV